MRRGTVLGCLLPGLLVAACESIPFEPIPAADMRGREPRAVLDAFGRATADDVRQLNTVVFEMWWKTFAAIGYLDVRRAEGRFSLACIAPSGPTLFRIVSGDGAVDLSTSLDELRGRAGAAEAIARDIRRAYLDLVPPDGARAEWGREAIVFSVEEHGERREYVFAGPDAVLAEKRGYECSRLRWRVAYFEYGRVGTQLVPAGIVLWNYEVGYRLVIRVKDHRPAEAGMGGS